MSEFTSEGELTVILLSSGSSTLRSSRPLASLGNEAHLELITDVVNQTPNSQKDSKKTQRTPHIIVIASWVPSCVLCTKFHAMVYFVYINTTSDRGVNVGMSNLMHECEDLEVDKTFSLITIVEVICPSIDVGACCFGRCSCH